MSMMNYLDPPGAWEPGIYELDSYEQYASIPALRSSELKRMGKTPAHYKAAGEYPQQISSTLQKSFDKGKAFDRLILHGFEDFDRIVVVEPNLNKNSKLYKQWRAEQYPGAVFLSEQERDYILKMREAAFKKRCFSDIFNSPGYAHRVLVWRDPSTGIYCKAELDWLTATGIYVDLKTAKSADFWFFARQARRLNYAHQGAYYLSGLTYLTGEVHQRFQLAVVETDPPFESHVFNVSPDMLLRAQVDNELRLETLARCLELDEWPGYPDQIIDLDSGQYFDETYDETDLDDIMEGF